MRELESKSQLHQMLLEAEEKTDEDLDQLRWQQIQQGLTPQQAQSTTKWRSRNA